jgi:hypothetical protein
MIKRPNLNILPVEEGTEVQTKGIENPFSEIIVEIFLNLGKEWTSKFRRHLETQTDITKKEYPYSTL